MPVKEVFSNSAAVDGNLCKRLSPESARHHCKFGMAAPFEGSRISTHSFNALCPPPLHPKRAVARQERRARGFCFLWRRTPDTSGAARTSDSFRDNNESAPAVRHAPFVSSTASLRQSEDVRECSPLQPLPEPPVCLTSRRLRVERDVVSLCAKSYYWPDVGRNEAESRLACEEIGSYLVRRSTTVRQADFVLSVRLANGISHLLIIWGEGGYALDMGRQQLARRSMTEFVENLASMPDGLQPVRLRCSQAKDGHVKIFIRQPVRRLPSLEELCRVVIRDRLSRKLDALALPLSRAVRSYLLPEV